MKRTDFEKLLVSDCKKALTVLQDKTGNCRELTDITACFLANRVRKESVHVELARLCNRFHAVLDQSMAKAWERYACYFAGGRDEQGFYAPANSLLVYDKEAGFIKNPLLTPEQAKQLHCYLKDSAPVSELLSSCDIRKTKTESKPELPSEAIRRLLKKWSKNSADMPAFERELVQLLRDVLVCSSMDELAEYFNPPVKPVGKDKAKVKVKANPDTKAAA